VREFSIMWKNLPSKREKFALKTGKIISRKFGPKKEFK
jgi:hypothetical protein